MWGFIYQDKTGAGKIAPLYCPAKEAMSFPANAKPDLSNLGYDTEKVIEMTELSNNKIKNINFTI